MRSCSGPPLLVIFWLPPRTSGGGSTLGDVFVAWMPPRGPTQGPLSVDGYGIANEECYLRYGPNISQARVDEAELGHHESRHVDQRAVGTFLAGPFAFPLAYLTDGAVVPRLTQPLRTRRRPVPRRIFARRGQLAGPDVAASRGPTGRCRLDPATPAAPARARRIRWSLPDPRAFAATLFGSHAGMAAATTADFRCGRPLTRSPTAAHLDGSPTGQHEQALLMDKAAPPCP